MLLTLRLQHFALIQESLISFEKGLNILTGETGAGKTILIQAIHLLMGKKADTDIISNGEGKAIIEAAFDIEHLPTVYQVLDRTGFAHDDNTLIIKREVSRNSKNQIFINAQLAPLQILKELGSHLFELAGQNASIVLRSSNAQRNILDIYGKINKAPYIAAYAKEKELLKKLIMLKNEKQDTEILFEKIQSEIESLQAIDISEDEETLYTTYKKYVNSQTLIENLTCVIQGLENTIFPALNQFKRYLPENELLEAASAHLNELSFSLSSELDELSHDPQEIALLEKKLSMINTVKTKYRLAIEEIPERICNLKIKLEHFQRLDLEIEHIEKNIQLIQERRKELAVKLTKQRHNVALNLQEALTREIRFLNMRDAQFFIEITPKETDLEGSDTIAFLLAANLGEKPALVKNKVSGGELSRLFLALKVILAEKDSIPTLVFDEIDANIGGETASFIGENLQKLSQSRQVLCITHFAQVARFASHHLLITKQNRNARTFTTIQPLYNKERQDELLRMMGGKNSLDSLLS